MNGLPKLGDWCMAVYYDGKECLIRDHEPWILVSPLSPVVFPPTPNCDFEQENEPVLEGVVLSDFWGFWRQRQMNWGGLWD